MEIELVATLCTFEVTAVVLVLILCLVRLPAIEDEGTFAAIDTCICR